MSEKRLGLLKIDSRPLLCRGGVVSQVTYKPVAAEDQQEPEALKELTDWNAKTNLFHFLCCSKAGNLQDAVLIASIQVVDLYHR